jgi:hypothetical protein
MLDLKSHIYKQLRIFTYMIGMHALEDKPLNGLFHSKKMSPWYLMSSQTCTGAKTIVPFLFFPSRVKTF